MPTPSPSSGRPGAAPPHSGPSTAIASTRAAGLSPSPTRHQAARWGSRGSSGGPPPSVDGEVVLHLPGGDVVVVGAPLRPLRGDVRRTIGGPQRLHQHRVALQFGGGLVERRGE